MLVLTRRTDEIINIGADIQIMVVEIRGDKVRLGVTAPKSVPVHRNEIFKRIHAQPCPDGKPATDGLPIDPNILD